MNFQLYLPISSYSLLIYMMICDDVDYILGMLDHVIVVDNYYCNNVIIYNIDSA